MSTSQDRLIEWFTGDHDREVTAAAAEALVRTMMPHVKPGSERFYSLVLSVAHQHDEDEEHKHVIQAAEALARQAARGIIIEPLDSE